MYKIKKYAIAAIEKLRCRKVRILAAVLLGLLAAVIGVGVHVSNSSKETSKEIQQGIADEIIRFHVLANSDSEEDQNLKIKVKTRVVDYLENLLGADRTLADTRAGIQDNIEDIKAVAQTEVNRNGYDYPVTAKLTMAAFPQKTYGDCTFPQGEYEALQIKIGEAEGQNWWCVLYPGLCFVDEAYAVVTEEKIEELKGVLTVEEFQAVTEKQNTVEPEVKIKFKWLKW